MDHKLWDDLAADYDKSVEDNQTPTIIDYLNKEIEILTSICSNITNSAKNYSIIDMGAGTGRVLFALDKNLKTEYFESSEPAIVMCLYNTLGVIPSDKRQMFVDNMKRIAGDDGLTILTAFNGDNFGFVAPKMYHPMMPMIKQIDDNSFDEKNRIFQNNLGFRSQWFKQNELKSLLRTEVDPIPIDVKIDDKLHTFGNVYLDRKIK